jgi:subtilisin family serine protease
MRLVGALLVLSVVYSTLVHGAFIEPGVYEAFEEHETVSVIVELEDIKPVNVLSKASAERREQQMALRKERIQRERSRVMDRLGLTSLSVSEGESDVVTREFSILNAFTGNITKKTLDRIAMERSVKAVYLERVLQVQLNDTRVMIDTQLVQGGGLNIDGSGEAICVLDSGIDYNHTSLGGGWGNLVLDGYDYTNGDADPWDDNGHGTHVAGIIASQHSLMRGVAPGARLLALKVCNSGGTCTGGAMISGMDWCINNAS